MGNHSLFTPLILVIDPVSTCVLFVAQVPVDTDLQEIIKEISIMQQCDSPYIVKYYGSYFKNTDLWVSNIMKTR